MGALETSSPLLERRKPRQRNQPKDYGWTLYILIVCLMVVAGFFQSHNHPYKPGDTVGYTLGLVGGLMILSQLLYPMRKRAKWLNKWAILPKWFKWHMIVGILGPALILLHSAFHMGSTDGAVAMVCMMLVTGSGVFGRFVYAKIHYGLYGREASQAQLLKDLEGFGNVNAIFNFAPGVTDKLLEFRDFAMNSSTAGKGSMWNVLTIGLRGRWLAIGLVRQLEEAIYADVNQKKRNDVQIQRLDELYYQNESFVRSYIASCKELAQLGTYEKLFSLWHRFHVPIVCALVLSAVWHVFAVRMI
jgi:hypothetical protein